MNKAIFCILLTFLGGLVAKNKIAYNSWADSLIHYEKEFQLNDSILAPKGKGWFEFKKGYNKILITAGHATAQTREGEIKQSETGTGALALVLNKITSVSILYTTYMSPSDPNFYDKNAFKDTLAELIKRMQPDLIIDLHGANPRRVFDLDFGTLHGKSYMNQKKIVDSLKIALRQNGIKKLSRDFFSASKNYTITRFVHRKGIPCLQLEINSSYLMPASSKKNRVKTEKLVKSLTRFINNYR